MTEKKFKHCMLGEMGVGKTSIVSRYTSNVFDVNSAATLGVALITKDIELRGEKYEFNIWDTAGSERFRSMVSMYYRSISSCMIVYDITNRESFNAIEGWYKQFKNEADNPNAVIVVVGTKADLENERQVSTEEGQQLATQLGCLFAEVTSVSGDSVKNAFEKVIEEIDITTCQTNKGANLNGGSKWRFRFC